MFVENHTETLGQECFIMVMRPKETEQAWLPRMEIEQSIINLEVGYVFNRRIVYGFQN